MEERHALGPTTADEVTTEWLTGRLRAVGNDVDVLGFRGDPIGNGMMAAAQRLTLALSGDDENAPKTLVLNYTTDGGASQHTGRRGFGFPNRPGFYEQEGPFYRDFAARLDVRVPKSYAEWFAPEGDRFVVEPIGVAAACLGPGLNYAWKGHYHGEDRGRLIVDGECIDDIEEPELHQLRQALARVTDEVTGESVGAVCSRRRWGAPRNWGSPFARIAEQSERSHTAADGT